MKYTPPPFDPAGAPSGPDQSYFDDDGSNPGAIVMAKAVEEPQREIVNAITAAGLTPDAGDLTQLYQAIQAIVAAGAGDTPYDLPFMAGFAADGTGQDLAVQRIGATTLGRPVTFEAMIGDIGIAPVGAAVELDIHLNGASIYSSRPVVAVGALTVTPGVLSVTEGNAGDLVEAFVSVVGSSVAGQALSFTQAAKVRT